MALRDLSPRTGVRFDHFLDGLTDRETRARDGVDPALSDVAARLQRAAGQRTPSPMPAAFQPSNLVNNGWTSAKPAARRVAGTWRPRIAGSMSALTSGMLCVVLALGILFSLAQSRSGMSGPDRPWLYLADFERDRLVELDPRSLDETSTVIRSFPNQLGTSGLEVYYSWLVSADGSTVVEMAQKTGLPGVGMPVPTFQIFDSRTGLRKSTISRMAAYNALLSSDGHYLLLANANNVGVTFERPDLSRDPPPEWYVYDTYLGRTVTTITSPDRSPTVGSSQGLSLVGSKFLFLAVSKDSAFPGPWPVQLVAYDLATGQETGRVDLPDVRAGFWPTKSITVPGDCVTMNGKPMETPQPSDETVSIEPGIAVSPDGRTVAIVHADRNSITTIDVPSNRIMQTVPFFPTGIATVEHEQPCQRGDRYSRSAAFSSDGRHLFVTGYDDELASNDRSRFSDYGIQRVDLQTGDTTSLAAENSQTGNSFRVIRAVTSDEIFITTNQYPTSVPGVEFKVTTTIQRVDATSLDVLSERHLDGGMYLLASPSRIAPLQTEEATPAATPVAVMDGAMTLYVRAVGGSIDSLKIIADGKVVFDGPLDLYSGTDKITGRHVVITSSHPGNSMVVQEDGTTTLMRSETEEFP